MPQFIHLNLWGKHEVVASSFLGEIVIVWNASNERFAGMIDDEHGAVKTAGRQEMSVQGPAMLYGQICTIIVSSIIGACVFQA